jgi:hypothetical protein
LFSSHFDRFAALSFAIFIARTFFMIRRNVALSAALNVVLAIAETLLMKIANANLYFRAVFKRLYPSWVFL